MAGQTLTTIIAINAQANGFGQVGATLTELGTLVNGMSQKLINFGKESWEVYKDYEKSMHEAEVALSTSHGRNTKELADAMDTLNAKATEWAATTIFHTDDVANAINQAAHAGWDLDQILNGIPVAMQLAQAGSMDLSQALEYITKTTKAFGVPYEELGDFIDMWVYAANSSTGDVQDFGDAMKKLGATMRFTDSKEELFALIGLMHDMGESGSTAATLLRTSMMRIIAPSGVASKVMEQLGATDEEIREIREDASKLAALQTLEDYGFNAFKDNGQAKPMIQIYAELGEVLSQIAGGYDNITKNQTTLGILSTIFGTRGITGALNIVTALQNAVELRDKLLEGNAEGYGQYAAETMMDTAYGKEEIFESKIERLKQVVGEELAGQVEGVMENVGHIVDNIAEMDEGKFSALVSGLEVIAGAGPALLLAGGAFRLIGTLLTPAGGIGLGLIALTAAATAIEKLQQADLRDTFGDMQIDKEGITNYVQGLGEDFRKAYEYTDQFQDALGKAVTNYRDASSTFSTNLFSMMITNAKLTPTDLEGLLNLAQQVQEYAQEALYTAASGDAEYWTQLFGGDEAALEDPVYQSIIEKTNKAYEENKSELEGIGKGLREAITSAFDDDQLDEGEYNKILEYFRRYNDMVAKAAAQAQEEEQRIQMRKWLLQAQTGEFGDINELSKTAAAERDALMQKENDLYLDKMARLIENGGSEEERRRAEALHQQRLDEINTQWDNFQMTLWDSQLSNNGQMDNWQFMKELADKYTSGQIDTDDAVNLVTQALGKSTYSGNATVFDNGSDRAQMAKITGYMIQALGGDEAVQNKIDLYTSQGNTEMANRLKQLYAMKQLANNFYDVTRTDPISLFGLNLDLFGEYETNAAAGMNGQNKRDFESKYVYGTDVSITTPEEARNAINILGQGMDSVYGLMTTIGDVVQGRNNSGIDIVDTEADMTKASMKIWRQMYESLSQTYDLDAIAADMGEMYAQSGLKEYYAMWDLIYGQASKNAGQYMRNPAPEETEQPMAQAIPIQRVQTGEGAADKLTQLEQQGIEVNVSADATELTATIDGEDGKTLMEYLDGDATDLQLKIYEQDGVTLKETVTGDASLLASTIASYNGTTITVNIAGKKLFAEGGRATTASVFGEAGPEWAIPEQHSERTADLLNAARAASGFTWNELLARFGGLNANPQRESQPTNIVYSPTINANDAAGVEQVLKDDKERFEKWYKDQKMRDEAEVYA